MIVAAHAGTGKTHFAAMYPDKVIDFTCMPYKYHLDPDQADGEAGKANLDNVMRPEWPYNYAEELIRMRDSDKIILIPSVVSVLRLLDVENIPYILVYPQRNSKDAYRKRYTDRGNKEVFLKIFIDGWDCFLECLEQHPHGRHIVLDSHQFLSDVIEV